MNYILHLNHAFHKFCEDEKLTPFHISLYFALFQYWNMAKFRNPISISRDELMRAAKIGSVNTYIRCMKELDKWAYIQYKPSYNPQKGSQVYLYNFDKTNNNATDISYNKSTDKTAKKANANTDEMQVIPSINSKNNTNKLNSSNENEPARRKNSREFIAANSKKAAAKNSQIAPPGRSEVETYFAAQKWPAIEAKKFFNHYQSNGWMVGKVPMQNWQASAEKWMLSNQSGKTTNLHTSNNKDYAEPL